MTTLRRRAAAVTASVLVASLLACSSGEDPPSATPAGDSTPSNEETVSVEDDTGDDQATLETPASVPTITLPPLTDPPHFASLPWGNFRLADRVSDRLFNGAPLRFALSVSDTAAADAAALEQGWAFGIEEAEFLKVSDIGGRIVGSDGADAAAQADELLSLVESGQVDCLVVDAANAGRIPDTVDEIVAAGVPVFTVGVDAPGSKRFAHYGLDDADAGRFAGSYAGQWFLDRRILVRKAAVLAANPSASASQKRMEGFIEAFLELQPHVEFANGPDSVEPAGADADAVYESSSTWLGEHPDVDLVFFADEGLEAFARAVADVYLHGDVFAVGFGMSQVVGNLIHDGVVVAALLEGYAAQAAAGARACADFLLDGVYDVGVVGRDPGVVHENNLAASGWKLPQSS